MNNAIAAAILILTLTIEATAQPDSLWSRTYGGRNSDRCSSIIETADGGFALAGYTESFGAGEQDFWLVRTDAEGDSLWSRTYGGGNNDNCYSLIETADGGFAMAGWTESFGAGGTDFWLVRTNAEGDSLWSATFGGGENDNCYSLIETVDGGFALAGGTFSFGAGREDFWLVRTKSEGDSLWSRTYGGRLSESCHSIIKQADGGFALAGWTFSFGDIDYADFWLVRTDAEGADLWSHPFGGGSDDVCYSVTGTADGGFALAGTSLFAGSGTSSFYLMKTNAQGERLWSHNISRRYSSWCHSLIETADGGFALAGAIDPSGGGVGSDCWFVRANSDGDSLWSLTFNGARHEECNSIVQTEDGGFALTGSTSSNGAGSHDFWLVKIHPDLASVSDTEFKMYPTAFLLNPAFPNPFNSTTIVSFQTPFTGAINASLVDESGREWSRWTTEPMSSGTGRIVLDGAGLPAGTYWLKVNQCGQTASTRLVLVK